MWWWKWWWWETHHSEGLSLRLKWHSCWGAAWRLSGVSQLQGAQCGALQGVAPVLARYTSGLPVPHPPSLCPLCLADVCVEASGVDAGVQQAAARCCIQSSS
jgi:hypothetical protein